MKKPGTTRMVLVILLVAIYLLFISQGMRDSPKPDLLIVAVPVIVGAILLIEQVIAKRIYAQEKERNVEDLNEKAEKYMRGED